MPKLEKEVRKKIPFFSRTSIERADLDARVDAGITILDDTAEPNTFQYLGADAFRLYGWSDLRHPVTLNGKKYWRSEYSTLGAIPLNEFITILSHPRVVKSYDVKIQSGA